MTGDWRQATARTRDGTREEALEAAVASERVEALHRKEERVLNGNLRFGTRATVTAARRHQALTVAAGQIFQRPRLGPAHELDQSLWIAHRIIMLASQDGKEPAAVLRHSGVLVPVLRSRKPTKSVRKADAAERTSASRTDALNGRNALESRSG